MVSFGGCCFLVGCCVPVLGCFAVCFLFVLCVFLICRALLGPSCCLVVCRVAPSS